MTTWTIEPLFEFEIETPERKLDKNAIPLDDGSVRCRHCGIVEANDFLFSISHSYVFNGWCSKRLMANNGANPDQLEWLSKHGFQQVDRFDVAYWDLVEDAN